MYGLKLVLIICITVRSGSAVDRIASLEEKLEAVVNRVKVLEDLVDKQSAILNEDVHARRSSRMILSSTKTIAAAPLVAFTAFLDKIVTNPAAHKPIPFNRVLINEGVAYNVTNGKFTCPQEGLYMFTYGIESDAAGHIATQLIVDGINQVNAVNGQYQNSGNTAVVRLANGQSVWVAVYGGNATIWNSKTYHYSTFSGVYLG